jgi:hypothetical protein
MAAILEGDVKEYNAYDEHTPMVGDIEKDNVQLVKVIETMEIVNIDKIME